MELKNTSGLPGDAIVQIVAAYSKIVLQGKYKHFQGFCNFPVVLLGVTANRIEISVAVFVGPIYVIQLFTLNISLGFHGSQDIIRLARIFWPLSRCRIDLEGYYDGISDLASPRLEAGLYPRPTLTATLLKRYPDLPTGSFCTLVSPPPLSWTWATRPPPCTLPHAVE